MDLFKKKNATKATSYDFYDTNISKGNTRLRSKEKRMLHKLSRFRIKQDTMREANVEYACCINNCEYNNNGECMYCGDYWTLNDENCISFEEK